MNTSRTQLEQRSPGSKESWGIRLSARRDANGRRPEWVRTLRRANQEVAAAERLCSHANGAVDGFLQSDLERVVPAAQVLRVPRGLQIARARLDRAARRVDRVLALAALDPANAAEAGLLVLEARERWLEAASFLTVVAIQACAAILVIENANPRPWVEALRAAAVAEAFAFPLLDLSAFDHDFLRPDGSAERERLRLFGRRRSVPLRMTDAPRRISRGRAPPFESTCQL